MKNLLFFVESLSGGGAEKVLVTLLNHLDKTKYKITLLSLVDTGILKENLNFKEIDYRSIIHPSSGLLVSFWNKLLYKLIYFYLPCRFISKRIIPQRGFDLYIAFSEGFTTKILASAPGKKLAWVHIDLEAYPWTVERKIFDCLLEETSVYQCFNKVVCVSESVEKVMIRRYGLTHTQTILNPVDTSEIKANAVLNGREEIRGCGFRFVSVGRLVKQKGYDKLIPIIRKLRDKRLDVSLYLIGEGENGPALKKMTEELDLKEHVLFVGYQKNPYAMMSQMDLFVCSSRAEGYSLVIAEALVLGLPVISMNCSGPDTLLDGGEYGVLCDSYEELYHSMEAAVTDPAFLNQLKIKSRRCGDKFDITETIRQVEALFDETICQPSVS